MTFGRKVNELRRRMGLTQEQLGEIIGASRQTVSKWELNTVFPEPAKLLKLCRTLDVTADELLSYLPDAEDNESTDGYGIYRGKNKEIVLTPRFALVFYTPDRIIGTKLYAGDEKRKKLCAVCEHNSETNKTHYSYVTENIGEIIGNDKDIKNRTGDFFDFSELDSTKMIDRIHIDFSGTPMPSIGDHGIAECLSAWRKKTSYKSDSSKFYFTLCTRRFEYVFSIIIENDNIYCGASNNMVFDLGLLGGQQYFRIRNYKDNSAPFCAFYYDFGYEPNDIRIPESSVDLTDAVQCRITTGRNAGSSNHIFFVKRFSADHIVLAGCGGDEYHYYRDEPFCEKIL